MEEAKQELPSFSMNFPTLGVTGAPLLAGSVMSGLPMPTTGMPNVPQSMELSVPSSVDRTSFICAHCGSQHVTNPVGRGGSTRRKANPQNPNQNRVRRPRPARPRSALIDGQKVFLCNACGMNAAVSLVDCQNSSSYMTWLCRHLLAAQTSEATAEAGQAYLATQEDEGSPRQGGHAFLPGG